MEAILRENSTTKWNFMVEEARVALRTEFFRITVNL
jgi:hypothetical protein